MISLEVFRQDVSECSFCSLRMDIEQVNVPSGPENAKIFVVGYNPGQDEELTGDNFCDKGGLVLKKLMEKSGIDFHTVWFTYLVKCWARKQTIKKENAKICSSHWLSQELLDISPIYCIMLGTEVSKFLIGKQFENMDYCFGKQYDNPTYPATKFIPFLTTNAILNGGKKTDAKVLKFFEGLSSLSV